MSRPVIIRGGTVITPRQRRRADILVKDGVIAAIGDGLPVTSDAGIVDAGGLTILPGIIDPHSHLWEAGFMSDPDFADSTASAAAGGITTVIDMPLTVPEVLDAATFREKASSASAPPTPTSHCTPEFHRTTCRSLRRCGARDARPSRYSPATQAARWRD